MSGNEILSLLYKVLVPSVPLIAFILIFLIFGGPGPRGGLRIKEVRRYYLKWFLIGGGFFLYYIVAALLVTGAFSGEALISFIPTLFIVLGFLVIMIVIGIILGPKHDYSDSEEQSYEGNGWLLRGRREYSRRLIENYEELLNESPNSTWTLKYVARIAVKKDKKNPEARYLLAQSYLRLHKLKKAEKQARAAVELEPDNETYRQLWDEIPKSGRTDIRV